MESSSAQQPTPVEASGPAGQERVVSAGKESGFRDLRGEAAPRVLATLNDDGSRRWLRPKLSPGAWWTRRRLVAYALMALFTVTPFVRVGGQPLFRFDVLNREFIFFGVTFFATETLLLALLLLSVFLGIFLITALFGRAWCGWACPQTVYMEYLYRPIERLAQGKHYSKGGSDLPPWRRLVQYGLYWLVSLFLANTFLAWFVGTEQVLEWMQQSPLKHPKPFLLVAGVTVAMMVDFCFFREQMCTIACPYGRLQSVLLDRDSLIVGYDRKRGEPRGRLQKLALGSEKTQGDCVDCGLCVQTCPTGIDIRDGLQMECIHCTQCMDACDAVMEKVGRPKGLIRYSAQNRLEGQGQQGLRPRLVIYPLLLTVLLGTLAWRLAVRAPAELTFLRMHSAPYTLLGDGRVSSQVHLKVQNKGSVALNVDLALKGTGELIKPTFPVEIPPKASAESSVFVVLPRAAFEQGLAKVEFVVLDVASQAAGQHFRLGSPQARGGRTLLGPYGPGQALPAAEHEATPQGPPTESLPTPSGD
jgi:cytochrome c oxidase accessory protein FixG